MYILVQQAISLETYLSLCKLSLYIFSNCGEQLPYAVTRFNLIFCQLKAFTRNGNLWYLIITQIHVSSYGLVLTTLG